MVGQWLRTQTRTLSLKHYRIVLIIYTIPATTKKRSKYATRAIASRPAAGKTRAVEDDPIRKPAGAVTFAQHLQPGVQGRFERSVLALLMNVSLSIYTDLEFHFSTFPLISHIDVSAA